MEGFMLQEKKTSFDVKSFRLLQEKIQKTQDEKDIMSEELSLIKKDIEKWEEEFKQENGREPKEEEK